MIHLFNTKLERDEVVNKLTHFPGIILGLIFLAFLIIKSLNAPVLYLISYLIYALTYIAVFTASTLYHSQTCSKKKHLYKKIDHASIYLFMAGCYTPFVIINMQASYKWGYLVFIWILATCGIGYKFYSKYKYRMYSTLLYLIFGYMCFFTKDSLLDQIPSTSFQLLLYGGILYSIGAIFYTIKAIPYQHGIWHIFVLAASTLHFIAIYLCY